MAIPIKYNAENSMSPKYVKYKGPRTPDITVTARGDMRWSQKTGQLFKVYSTI